MRSLVLGAVALAALGLSSCNGFAKFVEAAQKLDPDCGKDVQAKFATVFIFGVPVPILTEGSYHKQCTERLPQGVFVNGKLIVGASIPGKPAEPVQ